jgi:biopolymer transport protein ExbD
MLPILLFILVALIRESSFAIPIDAPTSSAPVVAAQGAKRIAAQIFQDGQIKAEEARKQAAEAEARKQAAKAKARKQAAKAKARKQDTDARGKPFEF